MTEHLVGVAEIADLLGVSRQRVDAITRTFDDFPDPVADLKAGRVWERASVEAWARLHGRLHGNTGRDPL